MTRPFDLTRIGTGLPVSGIVDQLGSSAVITAPPGTGKTTLVPPAISNHLAETNPGANPGKVIVTAPRRVAVRAAARRLAHLDGSKVGDRVGYSIRGEHHPGSLIDFVTPGVLLRRLLNDPELADTGAIIIDEVHERQLDTDLVLAMVAELAQLRDDLIVIAMSATLNAQAFADYLAVPIIDSPAEIYPLTIRYAPHKERVQGTRAFYEHVATQAAQTFADAEGDVLVFVPGRREIDLVCQQLRSTHPHLDTYPLHGGLSSAEQDAALSSQQRIVVATSIAESSLTVPGVRAVVDAGLSRVPRRDSIRNMNGLVTISTAKSSADQRAGRASRLGPGLVTRCYSEAEYQALTPDITPEIATCDLTEAVLTMRAWGELSLLCAPPTATEAAAVDTLQSIGALDSAGVITAHGRTLVQVPADPRLAHALVTLGTGAARWVAILADAPTGDITKAAKIAAAKDERRFYALAQRYSTADGAQLDAATVTATAYPNLRAQLVNPDTHEYLLASGTRAVLDIPALYGSKWLAVAEVARTKQGAVIRAAARLKDQPTDTTTTIVAVFTENGLKARERTAIGAITLDERPVPLDPATARTAVEQALVERSNPLDLFTFSEQATQARARLAFLHRTYSEPWPDVSDAALAATVTEWLAPEIEQLAQGTKPSKIDLYPALQRLLPWPEAANIDSLAPTHLVVASGRQIPIDYTQPTPTVSCKLQECFGMAQSPGNIPIVFHLLSPAGRPLAVTDDLESFWNGAYTHVRSEMRGRYPKHPWPEDPWNAQATAQTKRRM